jgi:5-methylthioribose kinase
MTADLSAALVRMGLMEPGETPGFTALTGGVSSDIWRVDLARGPVCVKRALPKLKVAADWRAPVGRNLYEARWMARAGRIVPEAVPKLLGQDEEAGALAMEYLAPEEHPVWKALLRRGQVRPETAAEVGRRLGRIHAATAADAAVTAPLFPTDAIFHAIRLEPYLLATARVHPDVAPALEAIAAETAATKRALVHGDVSPKNILVGPAGPIFIDAECAWWGDPAFDLAFCLNHLLLKCVSRPIATSALLESFRRLAAAHLAEVDWEDRAGFEARTARLLPGLLLARIDGKSPVEYITDERERDRVRAVAKPLLSAPVDRLAGVREAWAVKLTGNGIR